MDRGGKAGFTIIEIIVVTLLISYLGASGMGRFASMDEEARTAALNSVRGRFTAAVAIVHAAWVSGGTGVAGTVTLDGATVEVNGAGWPYIDTTTPGQDTAAELFQLVMRDAAPSPWVSCETASTGTLAGQGRYVLEGSGGGGFTYDGATGLVTAGATCP